ncbi:SPOR domain-containing protein [Corynebacterium anserum]|uniref:SPOR domain-containing protein n=1 Tax=Corynebacterium anserum TaxID=2684406 RepID=A0A7G7YMS7_9CORY|nr:SPOR domain-containing protein [Corynebacterium anserum]QNH95797.1 SPOR domain-containing protein [Corynebacterium anserum]
MSEKWYYDTKTGQVTQGKESGWDSRMGPYDTQEEAAAALETAKKRNEQADAYDADGDD